MSDKETIEASLFAAGRTLDVLTLSKIINKPKKRVDPIVQSLIREYKERECGLEIIDLVNRYVMQVKPKYTDLVRPLAPKEVGAPMLRTLSMIAYHQPVIQSDLVDMRGNAAYDHIRELKERGFIVAVPHGRTKMLRTTPMFADYFEIESNDPETIKKKIVDLSHQQSGQSGLDRWLGRKVLAVTPMYESLMGMCGIDDYLVIKAYDPTDEEIDKLVDVNKMVISKGYTERVRKHYDGEIIEVSSTTFTDLIDAIEALEGTYDETKAQECIERLKDLKERYASKALVISKKVQPATDMITRIINDLRIGVSANGVLIAPDYETSSEGVKVGKDADILVPTHKNLEIDLIKRVSLKYDAIIDGLGELDG
ncbi:MAG: SMC-Scp complex subunit ScpB [Methanosarcinaceae archaeon]